MKDSRFGKWKFFPDFRQELVPDQIALIDGGVIGGIVPPLHDILFPQKLLQILLGVIQKRADEGDAPDFLNETHGTEPCGVGAAEKTQEYIFDPVSGMVPESDQRVFRIEDDFAPVFQTHAPRRFFVAFSPLSVVGNINAEQGAWNVSLHAESFAECRVRNGCAPPESMFKMNRFQREPCRFLVQVQEQKQGKGVRAAAERAEDFLPFEGGGDFRRKREFHGWIRKSRVLKPGRVVGGDQAFAASSIALIKVALS